MADGGIPTAEEILRIHSRIEEKYDLKHNGTMKTAPKFKLRREVLEPAAEYDDPYHRAAVLLFGIPSVHVFEDGNKRTAWIATQEYLERSGINSEVPQDDRTIEKIVRRAGLFTFDELARWFETGEIDVDRLQ